MAPSDCPKLEQLRAFVGSEVDDAQAERIIHHLETCGVCEQTVVNLERESNTIASRVRELTGEEFLNEAPCQRLVQLAQAGRLTRQRPAAESSGTAPAADPLPRAVRDYLLGEKLGEGGMGAVYKAEHQRLKRTVAIKLLPSHRLSDQGIVSRFEREMAVLGKLTHPHIVTAFDAGEHEGRHYLVMEYVDGVDVSKLVSKGRPLAIADACQIARQAASGLQFAFEHGCVHRDIKPSNLMLARGPQGALIKILDLGLARALDAEQRPSGAATELTTAGQIMGTLDYMAPEQGDDSHEVDIRADLYSLGATLYKLLTGDTPLAEHAQKPLIQRLTAIATAEPTPVRTKRPEVPAELAAIVQRLLAKNPSARFATPAEVSAVLEPFCRGANLERLMGIETVVEAPSTRVEPAAPRTTPDQRRAPTSRRSLALWLGSAALAIALTLLTLTTRHGVILVEAPDGELPPDLQVRVVTDGQAVEILQRENQWSAKVVHGAYELKLTGGADRFELSDSKLTVTRLGRAILKVTRKPLPPNATDTASTAPPAASKPATTPSPTRMTPTKPSAPVRTEPPFRLRRGDRVVRSFQTLAGALAELQAGDLVEVQSYDRLIVKLAEPVTHPLTIRAAEGFRPWLDLRDTPSLGFPQGITIEGCDVDLRSSRTPGALDAGLRTLRRCRIWGGPGGLAGVNFDFQHCVLVQVSLGVYGTPSRVRLENCGVRYYYGCFSYSTNPAPTQEPVTHQLELKNCTFYSSGFGAGTFIRCDAKDRVRVEAEGNLFQVGAQTNVLTIPTERDRILWRGNDNCFAGPWNESWEKGADDKIQPRPAGLVEWRKVYPDSDASSRECQRVSLELSRTQRIAGPERWQAIRAVCASDLGLGQPGSVETRIQTIGLQWELLGPGDGYLRALAAEGRAVPPEDLRPERLDDGAYVLWRAGQVIGAKLTLSAAVDAAQDGDTIEIRTDGPCDRVETEGSGRLLTLRAAPGYAPVVPQIRGKNDRWVFEGLTFTEKTMVSFDHFNPRPDLGPILADVPGGLVRARNCRWLADAPLLGWAVGRDAEIVHCDLPQAGLGIRDGELHVRNSLFSNIAYGSKKDADSTPALVVERCVVWHPEPLPGCGAPLEAIGDVRCHVRESFVLDTNSLFAGPPARLSLERCIVRHSFQVAAGVTQLDAWNEGRTSEQSSRELLPWEFEPGH